MLSAAPASVAPSCNVLFLFGPPAVMWLWLCPHVSVTRLASRPDRLSARSWLQANCKLQSITGETWLHKTAFSAFALFLQPYAQCQELLKEHWHRSRRNAPSCWDALRCFEWQTTAGLQVQQPRFPWLRQPSENLAVRMLKLAEAPEAAVSTRPMQTPTCTLYIYIFTYMHTLMCVCACTHSTT